MRHVITAFKEHKEFKRERHWDANILRFQKDVITPPHYADTIEIIVNHGAEGDIYIDGKHCKLSQHQAYFIPPNASHSMQYQKNEGYISILKINHLTLKKHLNLETVLESAECSFDMLPQYIDDSEAVKLMEESFFKSESLFDVSISILQFFHRLCESCAHESSNAVLNKKDNLRRLIEWTEQNYMNNPTLEEAAAIFGYSKNYFCQKFRATTGVTYVNYLNCVRINHACSELKKGRSITDICYSCGFVNPSYFIKLFRSVVGVTPMKYMSREE